MRELVQFLCGLCFGMLLPISGLGQSLCGTDPYHLQQQRGSEAYEQAVFELEARLLEETLKQANRHLDGAVYTIPVVVHVMHRGELPGNGANISDAQVQAGIEFLNQAFRNTDAFAGDPQHTDAGIPSADIEINFCLASRAPDGSPSTGIERVATGLSDLYRDDPGSQPGQSQDREMKALSVWDPHQYLNIWLVNSICLSTPEQGCEVAGYATFAASHGMAHDGVVLEHAYWGSSASLSKIAVHEVGHYLNLYHTFQSACPNNDCLVDGDRVCDTPPENHPLPLSCASGETINSCSTDADDRSFNNPFQTDVQDMYENYMDYGFQSCQNTFTPGQKTRMRLALTQQRASLLESLGCVPVSNQPQVRFGSGFLETAEQASTPVDCRAYTDYPLTVQAVQPLASQAVVALNALPGSTATLGVDAELLGTPLTLPAGNTSPQLVTLRVYDDQNVEEDEVLSLELAVLSGDAVPAAGMEVLHVNLYDNDRAPSEQAVVVFSENFESTTSLSIQTAPTNQSGSNWLVGPNGGMSGSKSLYYDLTGGSGTPGYDPQLPASRRVVFDVDARGYHDLTLGFDYKLSGELNRDFGSLVYSLNGTDFFPLPGAPSEFMGVPVASRFSVELAPELFDDQRFFIGFQWQNDFNGIGSDPAWVIDQLEVRGYTATVETAFQATGTAYLGPYEHVFFFENSTGQLIAEVENLGGHDFGCTEVVIDRAGTGAEAFWDVDPARYLAQKTFHVTPTHNTDTGHYEITLYYTQEEIEGWATATGQKLVDLEMVKADGNINAINPENYVSYEIFTEPATVGSLVGDVAVSATFQQTGFSGFGAGVPGSTTTFPVEWVDFRAQYVPGQGTLLEWSTATEQNSQAFAIERSRDGRIYEQLAVVPAAGHSSRLLTYEFWDPSPPEGRSAYRLRQMDTDGAFSYSEVVEVEVQLNPATVRVRVFPNPMQEQLQVFVEGTGDMEWQLTTATGQLVKRSRWYQDRPQTHTVDVPRLAPGLYFWSLSSEDRQVGGKLCKQ